MIHYVPYEYPEATDVLMAFKAFAGPHLGALVEPDPLGSVNRVVSLVRGQGTQTVKIRTKLAPVPTGAVVRVGYDPGTPLIRRFGADWRELNGHDPRPFEPHRPASWYVEIDDRRVIEVPEHETRPPIPSPPRVPLRRRLRSWATKRARSAADGTAGRLGYVREDECGGDW